MNPEQDDNLALPTPALVALIRAQRGHLAPAQRTEGARAITARWRRRSRTGPARLSMRRASVAGATLAAAVLIAVTVGRFERRSTHALSYVVERGAVAREGVIEPQPEAEPKVVFSDGSVVSFGSGSVASLSVVDERGAHFSLHEGTGRAEIVHRPNTRWLFDVGPFLISVTGTAFNFGWSAAAERFEVTMDRGTVEVSGPMSDGAITLRSGQHLTVRVREGETIIRDRDDIAPPAPAIASVDDSSDRKTAASVALNVRPRSTPASESGAWAGLLASGNFETIVSQAERQGIEKCLAGASSAELAVLADASRYSRHDAIAVRALLAQRARFPGSGAARDAAFLLGRLEEKKHDARGAVDWYERYFAEDANGAYASEALGRRMLLTPQVDGADAAHALGNQYLARFPHGTYAASARTLIQGP